MKTIFASVFIIAIAYCELTPSNSYLPPPPNAGNSQGYSSGPTSQPSQNYDPQIVAARSLEGNSRPYGQAQGARGTHNPHVNPFGRSSQAKSPQDSATKGFGSRSFANEAPAGYDSNAANFARNVLEQIDSEPANYNFGYMVNDYQEGTDFGHHEERQEEKAQGEYHVVLPDGRKQTVSYQADERGFKPQISYEESQDVARSGYDDNANNFRSGNQAHGSIEYRGNDNAGHEKFVARSNGY